MNTPCTLRIWRAFFIVLRMKNIIVLLAFAGLLLGLAAASCTGGGTHASAQSSGGMKEHSDKGKKGKKGSGKKNGKDETGLGAGTAGFRILERWEMPSELKEISGIALVSPTVFACVQDEAGEIFLYNTAARRMEKSMRFSGSGDYEGIAIAGTTAWVMRSDGLLFEVKDFAGAAPVVTEHRTSLTAAQDVESLFLDAKRNRLLLAVKGKDPLSKDYRGVYPFDLRTKTLVMTPVFKIDAAGGKGKHSNVQPSDIALHPRTGDLYILDGPSSGLLILGADGREKAHYNFDKTDFPQPEGIAITAAGDLYISNEGRSGAGTILKVSLDGR